MSAGDQPDSPLFVSTFGTGTDAGTGAGSVSVVCLHGIESHGLRFVGLAARVPGIRVVAPDLRGHGRSPKVGPWTVEQHLDDMLPLLTSETGRAVLLGHSYGGMLAWRLAALAPDRISALILVDPAIAVAPDLAAASVTYSASSVGHSWPSEADAFLEAVATRPQSGIWSAALDVAVSLARGNDGLVRPVVAPDAVAAGWVQMQEPLRPSAWRGPTLLIEAGREDGRFVSPAVVAQLRSQLGDALTHVVIDTTHTIPSDYPDELAAAVRPFLTRFATASE